MGLKTIAELVIIVSLGVVISAFIYKAAVNDNNIYDAIRNAAYCSKDNECVLVDRPCNIVACGVAVNQEEAAKIGFMVNLHNYPKGEPPCFLACNKTVVLACIEGRCVVK